MAQALKTRDVPAIMSERAAKVAEYQASVEAADLDAVEKADRLRKRAARAKHGADFSGKKFKNLSEAQKDKLLKAMAIELGLLDDDDD